MIFSTRMPKSSIFSEGREGTKERVERTFTVPVPLIQVEREGVGSESKGVKEDIAFAFEMSPLNAPDNKIDRSQEIWNIKFGREESLN